MSSVFQREKYQDNLPLFRKICVFLEESSTVGSLRRTAATTEVLCSAPRVGAVQSVGRRLDRALREPQPRDAYDGEARISSHRQLSVSPGTIRSP